MRLLACLIVAPQRGYDEPATLSYAISSFCPTSADGLQPVGPESRWARPPTDRIAHLSTAGACCAAGFNPGYDRLFCDHDSGRNASHEVSYRDCNELCRCPEQA